MNDFRLSPDDPRLTAYALGELNEGERAAVEAAIAHDPAARRFVEQTREFAGQMKAALANEPDVVEVNRAQAVAPAPATEPEFATAKMPAYDGGQPKILRFPQLYFIVGGLAAAFFAVLFVVREKPSAAVPIAAQIKVSPTVVPPTPKPAGDLTTVVASTAGAAASETHDGGPHDSSAVGHASEPVAPAHPTATVATAAPITPATETGAGAASVIDRAAMNSSIAVNPAPQATVVAEEPVRAPQSPAESSALTQPTPGLGAEAPAGDDRLALSVAPFLFATTAQGPFTSRAVVGNRASVQLNDSVSAMSLPRFDATLNGVAAPEKTSPDPMDGPIVLPNSGEVLSAVRDPIANVPLPADTGSYAAIRRAIDAGKLPARDDVRIEELLNHVAPADSTPKAKRADEAPITATMEIGEAPWAPRHRLVRVAIGCLGPAGEILAKDVRVEVEFNPRRVSTYRLVGYAKPSENLSRPSAAPATGALTGGSVAIALIEIVTAPAVAEADSSGEGTYGPVGHLVTEEQSRPAPQLLTLRVHYRTADTGSRGRISLPLVDSGATFAATSGDFKLSAAIAAYGMVLRDSPFKGRATLDNAIAWAASDTTTHGDADTRADFIDLMRRTKPLLR